MTWDWKTSGNWQHYPLAILIIAIAIRLVFFGGLGRSMAYLIY